MHITKKRRVDLIGNVWLFERCSQRELDVLQSAATALQVPAGRVLAEQGELGREFVVIVDGKASVTRDGTEIAVLGGGSFFGEMSLLDGRPRSATVTTLEPTQILVLTSGGFRNVVNTMPSVDRKMLAVLAERLRDIETKYVPAHERNTRSDIA
jgi:CRP-like cAMP-binding protein